MHKAAVWLGVGAGVAALGGGAYLIARRSQKTSQGTQATNQAMASALPPPVPGVRFAGIAPLTPAHPAGALLYWGNAPGHFGGLPLVGYDLFLERGTQITVMVIGASSPAVVPGAQPGDYVGVAPVYQSESDQAVSGDITFVPVTSNLVAAARIV